MKKDADGRCWCSGAEFERGMHTNAHLCGESGEKVLAIVKKRFPTADITVDGQVFLDGKLVESDGWMFVYEPYFPLQICGEPYNDGGIDRGEELIIQLARNVMDHLSRGGQAHWSDRILGSKEPEKVFKEFIAEVCK